MIITSDGSLRLVDFELSRSRPIYDPFAFLLWIISDIHTRKLGSYERNIFQKLALSQADRVDHEFYPDRNAMAAAGLNQEFINDAFSSNDWPRFVERWHPRFLNLSEDEITKTA